MKPAIAILACLCLGACDEFAGTMNDGGTPPPVVEAPVETLDPTPPPPPPVAARTVEDFDTTSAADRAAAVEVPAVATETRLGTTIASLGSPTVPGIWMETPLVDALVMGRVENPATGATIGLELRPSGGVAGSGSQISLAAMRLLDIPLTELPELTVYR